MYHSLQLRQELEHFTADGNIRPLPPAAASRPAGVGDRRFEAPHQAVTLDNLS